MSECQKLLTFFFVPVFGIKYDEVRYSFLNYQKSLNKLKYGKN